eukprot:TRINITY_DN2877_c0_g1_i1.p1 TRINITY_DN2877_c0_g1~~TRINITY_DN2877_c0_g1_i1.p1  ORF type:complete len:585 (-),score=54.21 TRINITY_DN2877_c0_g1_i1:41-1795(-)
MAQLLAPLSKFARSSEAIRHQLSSPCAVLSSLFTHPFRRIHPPHSFVRCFAISSLTSASNATQPRSSVASVTASPASFALTHDRAIQYLHDLTSSTPSFSLTPDEQLCLHISAFWRNLFDSKVLSQESLAKCADVMLACRPDLLGENAIMVLAQVLVARKDVSRLRQLVQAVAQHTSITASTKQTLLEATVNDLSTSNQVDAANSLCSSASSEWNVQLSSSTYQRLIIALLAEYAPYSPRIALEHAHRFVLEMVTCQYVLPSSVYYAFIQFFCRYGQSENASVVLRTMYQLDIPVRSNELNLLLKTLIARHDLARAQTLFVHMFPSPSRQQNPTDDTYRILIYELAKQQNFKAARYLLEKAYASNASLVSRDLLISFIIQLCINGHPDEASSFMASFSTWNVPFSKTPIFGIFMRGVSESPKSSPAMVDQIASMFDIWIARQERSPLFSIVAASLMRAFLRQSRLRSAQELFRKLEMARCTDSRVFSILIRAYAIRLQTDRVIHLIQEMIAHKHTLNAEVFITLFDSYRTIFPPSLVRQCLPTYDELKRQRDYPLLTTAQSQLAHALLREINRVAMVQSQQRQP